MEKTCTNLLFILEIEFFIPKTMRVTVTRTLLEMEMLMSMFISAATTASFTAA
ncbi:hypothetical protein MHI18_21560 [Peribacillus sp. FSL H8-0477]|uniref:hypothetical protein n=1 Tax=Peribacillus sp. FSL H8-0477 TaxID=2921388 RepID=UPI0030F93CB7